MNHLREGFTCHLFDLPCAGLSRWSPDQGFSYGAFVQVVEQAVKAMDLEKFVLVGHDSGGGLARAAGVRMKGQLAGLVLGNTETPGNYSPLFRALFAAGRLPLAAPVFALVLGHDITRIPFELTSPKRYPELREELNQMFLRPLLTNRARLQAALTMLQRFRIADFDSLREAHAKIEAPVQMVWGSRDRWFPLEHARSMLAEFSGPAELEVADQAGLLVHEECPDLFGGAVGKLASVAF